MGRKKSEFVKAKKRFNSVKYFPFDNVPGDSFVLTSDPWNYLKSYLKNEHDQIKKKTESLGPKKERLAKAIYFLELAENFQKSAESVLMPTKATLTYYSVLNVAKAFLLVRGHDLEQDQEYHGLSMGFNDTKEISISSEAKNGINIFHEFAREFGHNVNPSTKIGIREMISNLPAIHELAFNLGLTNKSKRKFLPVEVDFLSNEGRWNKLKYSISFEKKHKHEYRVEKFNSGNLHELLEINNKAEDLISYHSKKVKNLTHTSDTSWYNNYKELCEDLDHLKVRTMLTRVGYKYYLDLQPDKYCPMVYYFLFMFYIGSIARYRPSLNAEILEGEYQTVVLEALVSCPKQFLYQMAGYITKSVCAIPMANLN